MLALTVRFVIHRQKPQQRQQRQQQPQPPTTTTATTKTRFEQVRVAFLVTSWSSPVVDMMLHGDHGTSWWRRQRRLRSWTSNACASRAVEVQQCPARAFSTPQRQRDEPLGTTEHPAQDQVAAGGRSRGDGYEGKASSPEMREDLEAASVRSAARKPFYKRNEMRSSCCYNISRSTSSSKTCPRRFWRRP